MPRRLTSRDITKYFTSKETQKKGGGRIGWIRAYLLRRHLNAPCRLLLPARHTPSWTLHALLLHLHRLLHVVVERHPLLKLLLLLWSWAGETHGTAILHHPLLLTRCRHPLETPRHLRSPLHSHSPLRARLHGRQLRDPSPACAAHRHLLLLLLRPPRLLSALHSHPSLHHWPRLLLLLPLLLLLLLHLLLLRRPRLHLLLLRRSRLQDWYRRLLLLLLLLLLELLRSSLRPPLRLQLLRLQNLGPGLLWGRQKLGARRSTGERERERERRAQGGENGHGAW